MAWLKGKSTHAHGYGNPCYLYIGEGTPNDETVERAKEFMKEDLLWPDRDGIREPVFEVIDRLPEGELQKRIAETRRSIQSAEAHLQMLLKETPA